MRLAPGRLRLATNRVARCHKDDRYSRGRGLRSERRGSARDRDNHGHLAVNEIGQQRWKSIVLILRPAVFDRYVLALDIAGFAQTLTERAQTAREHVRRFAPEVSDHWHRGLLRARRERPRRRAAHERYERTAVAVGMRRPTSRARASSQSKCKKRVAAALQRRLHCR